MLKKRLIFTLLYEEGNYNHSRNFNLQKAGNVSWIDENYEFLSMSQSIDELIVLDVSRECKSIENLILELSVLAKNCFMPISAGGGVKNLKNASTLIRNGADKIVINSLLFQNENEVKEIIKHLGTQAVVGSIDYLINNKGERKVYTENGSIELDLSLEEAVKYCESIGVGELYVTCINKDGKGNGYDLDGIKLVINSSNLPIIASGGAGNYNHFAEALNINSLSAVSTANLFNFMIDGLAEARKELLQNNYNLAIFKEFINE